MALEWNGDAAEAAIVAGAVRGLNRAASQLLTMSTELVPVDSTDLRKSGGVHEASADDLESRVEYNTPYAVTQHERLDFYHPKVHNPNAQAKFLERPATENREQLVGIVAAEIRRSLGS